MKNQVVVFWIVMLCSDVVEFDGMYFLSTNLREKIFNNINFKSDGITAAICYTPRTHSFNVILYS